jgi:hypothetical protein
LQKETDVFTIEEKVDEPGMPYFGLMLPDLTTIKPNYESMIKTGHLKVNEQGGKYNNNTLVIMLITI